MLDELLFHGDWVLVTGAGSGIGRATAQVFDELGARIVLVGRTEETLRETATTLDGEARVEIADVTDETCQRPFRSHRSRP